MKRTSAELIEPFTAYSNRCGVPPFLRGWKHRKTMTVGWSDGLMWHYLEFEAALDCDAMNAALVEIWERYKPQCDRRAIFHHGGVHGCMAYVPIAAGLEAMAVVREHFNQALSMLPSEREHKDVA